MPETQTATQYEVRYVNHRRDGKVVKLGFYNDLSYAADVASALRQEGYLPVEMYRRDITRTFSDWEPVKGEEVQHEPTDRESAGPVAVSGDGGLGA